MGETVGLLGPDGQEIILPVYTDQAFATWRTWVHLLNVEMMNANEDSDNGGRVGLLRVCVVGVVASVVRLKAGQLFQPFLR